jgi:hypothetical protein
VIVDCVLRAQKLDLLGTHESEHDGSDEELDAAISAATDLVNLFGGVQVHVQVDDERRRQRAFVARRNVASK